MGQKKVKTVKVDQSKAKEWEDYADEIPEVDSVSHLIRLSVEKEIGGEYDVDRRRAGDDNPGDDGTSGEILTALRGIQTTIEDMEERLAAVEDVTHGNKQKSFKRIAYDHLPEFHVRAFRCRSYARRYRVGGDVTGIPNLFRNQSH